MTHAPIIFDRKRVRRHRDRAAAAFSGHDFLFREMAQRLAERLGDTTRTFPQALALGAAGGLLAEHLTGKNGIRTLVQSDLSPAMLHPTTGLRLVADQEFLPFGENSFDLIASIGSLHWVNDVPGALIQIHRALKPDGLFLGLLPGGETLKELRQSFEQAEVAVAGGVSPRISPFIDVRDAGSLLQRAKFSMPVTDSELLAVSYSDPLALLQDLRGMGETNALIEGTKTFTRRAVLSAAMEYYRQHFADDGRITATFELITLTGWKI